MRAVRAVALNAPLTRKVIYGVVFKYKGARCFSMTRDTVLLTCLEAFPVISIGVCVVAVATDHFSFGNGVMKALFELRDLTFVALSAESGFVRFQ